MSNCIYCGTETKHRFCKLKCEISYNRKLDNDLMAVNCFSILNKNYNSKEQGLIKKYINSLTPKQKREKLPITGGVSC